MRPRSTRFKRIAQGSARRQVAWSDAEAPEARTYAAAGDRDSSGINVVAGTRSGGSEMQIGMRSLSRRAQWTVAAAIAAVLFATWAASANPQAPVSDEPVTTGPTLTVGIPTETFNFVASTQRSTNWCWAASIQMTLNYYGVAITQEEIVARTYGTDRPVREPPRLHGEHRADHSQPEQHQHR